jgi:hypothetical protein
LAFWIACDYETAWERRFLVTAAQEKIDVGQVYSEPIRD